MEKMLGALQLLWRMRGAAGASGQLHEQSAGRGAKGPWCYYLLVACGLASGTASETVDHPPADLQQE